MTEWTDNRKAAVANATNAQRNVNDVVSQFSLDDLPHGVVLAASQIIAATAQVFATLDLADATRERTELERAWRR